MWNHNPLHIGRDTMLILKEVGAPDVLILGSLADMVCLLLSLTWFS